MDLSRRKGEPLPATYAELTTSDVSVLRSALGDLLDLVRYRRLDGWDPGCASQASRDIEQTSKNRYKDRPAWGLNPIGTVRTTAALFMNQTIEHAEAALTLLRRCPHLTSAIESQARLAVEAGSQAAWLLSPNLTGRARVARLYVMRRQSAAKLKDTVKAMGLLDAAQYGATSAQLIDYYEGQLGLRADYDPEDSHWMGCESQRAANYTKRAADFMRACNHDKAYGAYSLLSGAAHAELWHIQHGYALGQDEHGQSKLFRTPAQQAAQYAVSVCIDAVMYPFAWALEYLGRNASLKHLASYDYFPIHFKP